MFKLTIMQKVGIMKRALSLLIFIVLNIIAVKALGYAELKALGDSCMQKHDILKALQYFNDARKTHDNAEIKKKIAACHYKRAEYKKCIELLRSISRLNADSLNVEDMREMFYCYKNMGEYALQTYWGEMILQRTPEDFEVTADLAAAFNNPKIEMPWRARQITLMYLMKDPDNIPVMRQLADSYFLESQFDSANSFYKRLIDLGDDTYNVLYSLGMGYAQVGNHADARIYLEKAAKKSNYKNANCLYRLGTACVETDSVAEGTRYLNLALEMIKPDSTVMFAIKRSLGEGYYKHCNYGKAIAEWQEALKYYKDSPATVMNMAQAYMVMSKPEKAKRCYKVFLRMTAELKPNQKLAEMKEEAERIAGKYDHGKDKNVTIPDN